MQDHVEQPLMDPDAAVVFHKTSLRMRYMKKLTRDRVVPIMSGSVSWAS
jgi:hypothetical protein